MTALLDLTAELPVFAVALAGVAAFLLGVGTRRATTRTGCARCRATAARHARRAERPAFLGFPGHHAGQLPFDYGRHQLDPTWIEDDVARLPQRIPTAPDDQTVMDWLAVPQAQSWPPLTVGELLVEQALTEFERLHTGNTHQMEVAS
jgi:hypothetical protein